MEDPGVTSKLEESTKMFEDIIIKNQENVNIANEYVNDHEKLNELVEKMRDMTTYLNIELTVMSDTPYDTEEADKRIQSVDELLDKKAEGDKLLGSCQIILDKVLSHTSPEGCQTLSKLHPTSLRDGLKLWKTLKGSRNTRSGSMIKLEPSETILK